MGGWKSAIELMPKIGKVMGKAFGEGGTKAVEQVAKISKAEMKQAKDLRKAEGAIIEATNGNGFTVKTEHPASKAYATLVGKYNAMVKTVEDIILDSLQKSEGDELLEFLGGAKR